LPYGEENAVVTRHQAAGGHTNRLLGTQEFLAMMLGVQRTGVSVAAGGLQRSGLIRYSRGIVTILDRRGLRARACECYGLSKREFDRLLGDAPRRAPPCAAAPVVEVCAHPT
jgi:Crp-like helix-turn-helix domain